MRTIAFPFGSGKTTLTHNPRRPGSAEMEVDDGRVNLARIEVWGSERFEVRRAAHDLGVAMDW